MRVWEQIAELKPEHAEDGRGLAPGLAPKQRLPVRGLRDGEAPTPISQPSPMLGNRTAPEPASVRSRARTSQCLFEAFERSHPTSPATSRSTLEPLEVEVGAEPAQLAVQALTA